MDGQRFDEFTRAVATGATRRRLLKALVGGLAGLVTAGAAGTADAARKCSGSGGVCNPKKDRPCCAGATCVGGKCCQDERVCPSGDGGQVCAALENDPTNCGACGNACSIDLANATAVCRDGACGFSCTDGFKECAGACIPAEGCCTDADCDDGSGCTLDYCDSYTKSCAHVELTTRVNPCVECGTDAECANGGVCCGGRCCPAGAVCQSENGPQGLGICCLACGEATEHGCCDQIQLDETAGAVILAACVGEDASKQLPGFCCPNGNGGYGFDEDGDVVLDDQGKPVQWCVLPVFRR